MRGIFLFVCLLYSYPVFAQRTVGGCTYERVGEEEDLPLAGVHIHVKEAPPTESDSKGIYRLNIMAGSLEKGLTIRDIKKDGYSLSYPNFKYSKWKGPCDLVFKNSREVGKKTKAYYARTSALYVGYNDKKTIELTGKINQLQMQALCDDKENARLLSSLSGGAVPAQPDKKYKEEEDRIHNEIVFLYENKEINLGRIRKMAQEYGRLVVKDKVDACFYERLSRLQRGEFEPVFTEIRKECTYAVQDKEKIGEEEFRHILNNVKIVLLGSSSDLKLAESVLKALSASRGIAGEYEYAKFSYDYRPIEVSNRIIKGLKKYNLEKESSFIAYPVLQLIRDAYYTDGETKKGLKIDEEIMSDFQKNYGDFSEDMQLYYVESLFDYATRKQKEELLLKAVFLLNKFSDSQEKADFLVRVYFSLSHYYLNKRQPAKAREYVEYLEKSIRDNQISDQDMEIGLYYLMWRYYNGINLAEKANSCKDKYLTYLKNRMRRYPDVQLYTYLYMDGLYKFDMAEYTRLAREIIESPVAFDHYKACAHYLLGLSLIQRLEGTDVFSGYYNEEREKIYQHMKSAMQLWRGLLKRYPESKGYASNVRTAVFYMVNFSE